MCMRRDLCTEPVNRSLYGTGKKYYSYFILQSQRKGYLRATYITGKGSPEPPSESEGAFVPPKFSFRLSTTTQVALSLLSYF
jgi:hypothetical protein